MAKSKKMTEDELSALLDGQIADAVSYEDSELSALRDKALKYRDGVMDDLVAEKGKSSVVSYDVNDTISWIKPGLMRIFLASDRVVEFEPKKQGDEDYADQATDYINYLFLKECSGYKVLLQAFDDGLGLGNGVIKHWWDASPTYETESFSGLSDDAFTELVNDDDVEVLEHTAYPDPSGSFAAASPSPSLLAATGGAMQGSGAPVPTMPLGQVQPSQPIPPGPMAGEASGVPPQPLGSVERLGGDGGLGGIQDPGPGEGLAPGQLQPPALGNPLVRVGSQDPQLHDLKIKRKCTGGRLRLEAMPPEELLIPRDAKALDEDISGCGHFETTTRSKLIKRGFKRDIVDELPTYSDTVESTAKTARDSTRSWEGNSSPDKSMEKVRVYEWYPLVDYDGDGIAERRKVVIGDATGKDNDRKILSNEEWGDDLPFTDIVPNPVAHRRRGRSIFDDTQDIQRIKSVALRQMLDNFYLSNNPQREAVQSQVENPDELVAPTIGGVVWVKTANVVRDMSIPFVAEKAFSVVEYMDVVKTGRTGVGRQTMGLDPDALQNQTAEAVRDGRAASETQVEYMARNIGENLQRLFKCILRLVIKHQDKAKTIRLRDQWVEMDPKPWNSDMDCSINVGLGAGSKDRDMVMLQAIAGKQEMILANMGSDNPIVGMEEYRNTLAEMVQVGGLKVAEKYFRDVTPEVVAQYMQAQSQRPDPKMMELQAKGQMEQMKIEAKTKSDADKLNLQAQLEGRQAEADIATEQAKMQFEMRLKDREAALDERLAMMEYRLKAREFELEGHYRQQEHAANLQFRTQDQQVSHHFKSADHAMKQDAAKAKGADA